MFTLVAALLATLLATAPPTAASVPGKPFTETGCEEYSDSVARLYTAGLGRQPEEGGFDWWMTEYTSGRWSLPRAAVYFTESPEFAASYGSLDDTGFVRQLYRNVLGREGEPGGVGFWVGKMAEGMTRGTVLLRFAESPENIANSGTAQPALGEFNNGLEGGWICRTPTNAQQPTPTPTPAPTPAPELPTAAGWALDALAGATIAPASAPVAYDRDRYSGGWGWGDTDGDCQNDRHEVLIAESTRAATLSADGCYVEAGRWVDPYSGEVLTSASEVTIDHTVPLALAHRSGAWEWDDATKQAFHSDLAEPATLVVVGAATNQAKSDSGPDRWKPARRNSWCAYSISWVRVKERWSLTYTSAEVGALREMLETCRGRTDLPAFPTLRVATVSTAPTTTTTTAPPVTQPTTTTTQPAPTPGSLTLVSCDREAEIVRVRNPGSTSVSLSGWVLHDEGEKHTYHFSGSLAAGATLSVLTGPDASTGPNAVVWKRNHVWNNDGDTAHLVSPAGSVTTKRC